MATSALSGQKARVRSRLATSTGAFNDLGELRDFTLTVEAEELDATSHQSSGWRERLYGQRTWSLEAESLYVDDNTGQDQLRDALSGDTKLTLRIRPDPTDATVLSTAGTVDTAGEKTWQGDGLITGWDLAGPNDDVAVTNVSAVGTGDFSTVRTTSS